MDDKARQDAIRALRVYAGGGRGDGLYLVWGVHEGMRGARWIAVCGDGLVRQTCSGSAGADDVVGHVPVKAARDLAELVSNGGVLERAGQPSDPGCVLTLEIACFEDRARASFPPGDPDPALAAVAARFAALAAASRGPGPPSARVDAAPPSPADAPPRGEPADAPQPLDVEVSPLFWVTLGAGGLMTCGLVAVAMFILSRRFPRRLDGDGITLRDGRRFVWRDLRLRERVLPDGRVMGHDLLAGDGTAIRLAPGGLVEGRAVTAYALARLAGLGG